MLRTMTRLIVPALLLLLAAPCRSETTAMHRINGELRFSQTGSFRVYLVNAASFSGREAAPRSLALVPGAEEAEAGSMRFSFDGIPGDEYGIKAFCDLNGNGVHDKNFLGMPIEPWGMSWKGKKPPFFPGFGDMCFTLDSDMIVTIFIE